MPALGPDRPRPRLERSPAVDATNAEARAFFAPSLTEAQVMVEMYVVDERQRLHGGFEGWLQIARVVPVMWVFGLLGRLPGLRQLGHAVYKVIAANRVRRGRCTDELCEPGLVGSKGSGGSRRPVR